MALHATCRARNKTIQYAATSVYLALAAMMFACLFAQQHDGAARRHAHRLHADRGVAALAGISGYFNLFPGAQNLFAPVRPRTRRFQGPQRVRPVSDLADAVRASSGCSIAARPRCATLSSARHSDVRPAAELFARRLVSFRGVRRIVMVALAFLTAPTPSRALRILCCAAVSLALRWQFCWRCCCRSTSIGDMFQRARPTHSSLTTSAKAAASGCRNWRWRRCCNFPTAWARSNSRACTACSSTTSICRPSWFTAGSAA